MRSSMLLRAAPFAVATTLVASLASATNVTEFPDNGSEQMGRGGAWVARASDPLAAFFNPAGLAGQDTKITLQANVSFSHRCFHRTFAQNDGTNDKLVDPANGQYQFPRVCAEDTPFPNPQLGFTWKVNDRIGIGFLPLLGPSAVGKSQWPEFVDGKSPSLPSPQRYLLIDSNAILITPTIGAGFEVMDGLRLGASFQWGMALKAHFSNASAAVNGNNVDPANNDVKAQIDAKQLFIPGFTLGALWSATDSLDVAGWYKWSAPIDAKGDVTTYANYFTPQVASGDTSHVKVGDSSQPDCGQGVTGNPCGSGNNANIKLPIPMEAKLGLRFHKLRADALREPHRRDPLSQDLYDVEVDFTWANNSAFDAIQLRFPADASGSGGSIIPVNGIPGGVVPANADVPHNYKDVLGVRLGGDYNVMPDKLALRAGAFFETRGQSTTYQNIDFAGAERFGLSVGATYRIRFGESTVNEVTRVRKPGNALELMLGFGHIFFAAQDNKQPDGQGVNGLAGGPCNPAENPSGATCSNGTQKYRTNWPVNLGTITNSINVINVGVAYRF
jgi:long-subunit fatty acid transport protein